MRRDFLGQSELRSNAVAVVDDEQDHEFGTDRGPVNVTVVMAPVRCADPRAPPSSTR
jgi:hypothetical protein